MAGMDIIKSIENLFSPAPAAMVPETALYVDTNGTQWAGNMNPDGSFSRLEPMYYIKPNVQIGHAYLLGPAPDFALGMDLGPRALKTAAGPGDPASAPVDASAVQVARVPTPAEAAPAAFAPSAPASPVVIGTPSVKLKMPDMPDWTPMTVAGAVLTVASIGLSAYHGFKRNGDSAGYGILWGLVGGALPVVTPLVAVAQGFGKPSDDVRLGRLEGAFAKRPDLLQAMHAEMNK
jgi:hypothetical protein